MNNNVSHNILAPLVKTVQVNLPLETAFALFTDGIARWWPLVSHSVGGVDALSCRLEGWVGGRLYETMRDGSESTWGTLLTWDPPRRLEFTFHPGRLPDTAQTVEVTFEPQSSGTRLTLTHTGWETLGEFGLARRVNYDSGWDLVLGRFVSYRE